MLIMFYFIKSYALTQFTVSCRGRMPLSYALVVGVCKSKASKFFRERLKCRDLIKTFEWIEVYYVTHKVKV